MDGYYLIKQPLQHSDLQHKKQSMLEKVQKEHILLFSLFSKQSGPPKNTQHLKNLHGFKRTSTNCSSMLTNKALQELNFTSNTNVTMALFNSIQICYRQ